MQSEAYRKIEAEYDYKRQQAQKDAKTFKEKYPNKDLWVWSGFIFDENMRKKEVFKYIDTLVDGQYVDELHDPTLKWRGSSNQRVIDVQESLKQGALILHRLN